MSSKIKFDDAFINGAASWTNNEYGGLNIPAKKVVYVHGSVDPWHALGMTSTQENDALALYIRGTAHCANMYPSSKEDSPGLASSKLEVQNYLEFRLELPWLSGVTRL